MTNEETRSMYVARDRSKRFHSLQLFPNLCFDCFCNLSLLMYYWIETLSYTLSRHSVFLSQPNPSQISSIFQMIFRQIYHPTLRWFSQLFTLLCCWSVPSSLNATQDLRFNIDVRCSFVTWKSTGKCFPLYVISILIFSIGFIQRSESDVSLDRELQICFFQLYVCSVLYLGNYVTFRGDFQFKDNRPSANYNCR